VRRRPETGRREREHAGSGVAIPGKSRGFWIERFAVISTAIARMIWPIRLGRMLTLKAGQASISAAGDQPTAPATSIAT